MQIVINAPLKSNEIVELLEGWEPSSGVRYAFAGKQGLGLRFEVTGTSAEEACSLAKGRIRSSDFGAALYFSVSAV